MLNTGFDVFDLVDYDLEWLVNSGIKSELMQRYRVIPLYRQDQDLHLGMVDPTDRAAIEAIGFHTGLKIRPQQVVETQLDEFILKNCQLDLLNAQLELTLSKTAEEPVVDFVNHLIRDAVQKSASDIHIESQEDIYRIRFRQDGILIEIAHIPLHLAERVITRLKILSKLDISERRLPQDGRFYCESDSIDIRISTCPTLFGEKMVLRLLDSHHLNFDLNALGFTDDQKALFIKKITEPTGLILVTGPTGSGKTLTLYSALHYLNNSEKNISTVEDPIEIRLNGINQVNINTKIGLTFPKVLRTFLRQDPDIIMIGEIRDLETADIAMQAAQTGHLVLSTLHTNNAVETLMRLQSMGIAAHRLIHSISLIVSERLVRMHCLACTPAITPSTDCPHCYQGFRGRTGIFELLPMTETLANLILSGSVKQILLDYMKEQKCISLQEASMIKINQGITSFAEIRRVLSL